MWYSLRQKTAIQSTGWNITTRGQNVCSRLEIVETLELRMNGDMYIINPVQSFNHLSFIVQYSGHDKLAYPSFSQYQCMWLYIQRERRKDERKSNEQSERTKINLLDQSSMFLCNPLLGCIGKKKTSLIAFMSRKTPMCTFII